MSSLWTFCLITLLIGHLSKISMTLFDQWSMDENSAVTFEKWPLVAGHVLNVIALFTSMDHWSKSAIQIFERWCINRIIKQYILKLLIFAVFSLKCS